jgi:exodeoxyribonuclease V alpha subunit
VEAGNVMGEICHASATWGDAITVITQSRRFSAHSEVGRLARALNHGEVDFSDKPQQVFRHPASADPWQPDWLGIATAAFRALEKTIVHGSGIADILAGQTDFQILCALREGPYGVRGINVMVARALAHKPDSWYSGQPVIVGQNDHRRKLYNGDTGIVLPVADDGITVDTNGALKACFLVDGTVRTVSQAQMPDYESCYAITVHKSQGSEYRHVLLVLPSDSSEVRANPVLGKELAYTAVTRSKERVDVSDGDEVLETMAARSALRMSGLGDLL